MGYYSTPNEPNHWTCKNGCHIHDDADIYRCEAKGCPDELLCIGCIWNCGGCDRDYCEAHILDASGVLNVPYTVFLCGECLDRRKEAAAEAA